MNNNKEKFKIFSWFKSEYKIKRWLVLAAISVFAICYALSTVFVTVTLDVKTIIKIIVLFVLGFVGIVVSYISMQRQTLEIMVKQTDKRDNVKSLIYNKKVYSQGPKIVVIGGGNGLNSVLRGLKNYTENITAVVTGYDEQSESKKEQLAEDIKESIVALSKNEDEMRQLLEYQFSSRNELTFGDIYLMAMQDINSNLCKSIEMSKDIFNITGKVLPVTSDKYEVGADFNDGSSIVGKSKIPIALSERFAKIERVYLTPSNVKTSNEVITAIMEADAIVIGPGSIYTSIIPNLLVKGVSKALKETKAFKVYVSNIMTDPGETYSYSLSDHIKAIKRHLGEANIDYCIYDSGEVMPEFIRQYNSKGSELVEQDLQKAKAEGVKLIKRDLATTRGKNIRHDSEALAVAIIDLICEDLKFKDKQNDPEYLFLEQKIRYKRTKYNGGSILGKVKKKTNGKSKFYNKYEERIKSIKESKEKNDRITKINEKNNKMIERVNNMKQIQSNNRTNK